MNDRLAERLLAAIRAAAPGVTGVSVGTLGSPATVQVSPPGQQAAAQAAIEAFDWSPAAHGAWLRQQTRAAVTGGVDARGDDLAVLIRAALRLLNASLNEIRTQVGLPTKTWTQVKAALSQMVTNGQGDPEA